VATLWRRNFGGTRYEVREHGSTRRLFSDGVFHSAWNERTGLTGRAWDLFLPAAFALPAPPRRVLVLGIGAGAVLLQYRRFIDPAFMLGVDLDPVHLDIGRRFFGLDRVGVTLVQADARDWVAAWDGPPFDLVVEDLYGHRGGEPCRAVAMDECWASALARLVAPGGALVVNFISLDDLRAAYQLRCPQGRSGYTAALRLRAPLDENVVAVFCRQPVTSAEIRGRLRQRPELDGRRRGCRLRYTARRLW
jgi:SAM-dependent methyltransferase